MDSALKPQKSKNSIRTALIASVAIIVILVIYSIYQNFFNTFEKKNVASVGSYVFKDNLSCTILYSTTSAEAGDKLSLLNLNTDEPRILFASGTSSPVKIIYNAEDILVLQLVANTSGSVDTVTLDKGDGTFARTTAGSFAGVYASAQKGNCN